MIEALIRTVWQETQGQDINPSSSNPGPVQDPASTQAKSLEQVMKEIEQDGGIVGIRVWESGLTRWRNPVRIGAPEKNRQAPNHEYSDSD